MSVAKTLRGVLGMDKKGKMRLKPTSEQERQDAYRDFTRDIVKGRVKSREEYRLK